MTVNAIPINKKLRFSEIVDVCAISSFTKLKDKLWWSKDDFEEFKKSCLEEITAIINRHWSMTPNQARKLLYQPGNMTIIYDEQNFYM